MKLIYCEKCFSTNISYVTNYEHLDLKTEDYVCENGWLCEDCETFYDEYNTKHPFFPGYVDFYKNNHYQTTKLFETNYELI